MFRKDSKKIAYCRLWSDNSFVMLHFSADKSAYKRHTNTFHYYYSVTTYFAYKTLFCRSVYDNWVINAPSSIVCYTPEVRWKALHFVSANLVSVMKVYRSTDARSFSYRCMYYCQSVVWCALKSMKISRKIMLNTSQSN